MEKVIREWRIVETDDGFRIEIKGDKETMRDWVNTIGTHGALRRARRWKRFAAWGPMGGPCGPRPWRQDEGDSATTEQ